MYQTSAGGRFTSIPDTSDILGVCAFARDVCDYADSELAGAYLFYQDFQLHVDFDTLYTDILAKLDEDGWTHVSYDWASLAGEFLTYDTRLNVSVASLGASIDASSAWTIGLDYNYRGKQTWIFEPANHACPYTSGTLTDDKYLISSFLPTGFFGTVNCVLVASGVGNHALTIQVSGQSCITVMGTPIYYYVPLWSWSYVWSGVTSLTMPLAERIEDGMVRVSGESHYSGSWAPTYLTLGLLVEEDAS